MAAAVRRGGKDPRDRRAAAGGLAGSRHQRLRVPQRGQRPVRGPRQRRAVHAPLLRLGRDRPALPGDGLPEEDADRSRCRCRASCRCWPSSSTAWRRRIAGRAISRSTASATPCARSSPVSPFTARTYRERGASDRDRRYVMSAVNKARRAQPGHHGGAVPFRARHAAAALPGDGDGGGSGGAAALRRQVPAGDVAGDGQGHRGHGVLRLQPAGVAQRGRRRPGPVRRPAGRVAPLLAGPPGRVALGAVAAVHPRHQARRGRARPAERAVGNPRRVEGAARGAGAGSTNRSASRPRTSWRPTANEQYLLYQTLLGAWPLEPTAAES